jgi:integrase/recombinase XerD
MFISLYIPYSSMQQFIDDYLEYKHGLSEISPAWDTNTRNLVSRFLSYLNVQPDKATTDDVIKTIGKIRQNKKLKQNYQRQLINTGKSVSIWLARSNTTIDVVQIAAIELPKLQWKTKKPEDMLTPDEVSRVIQTARNPRDKALLATLYDGSNRPTELLRLKWSDIIRDEYGSYFTTDAKTDKERRIRLTNISLGYLNQWQKKHPDPSPDQYVFCTINATAKGIRPVSIDNLQRLVKNIKRDTGIKKLKPSIFRPTRITHDVSSGYELPYIMKKNWGSLKTKMIDLYTNIDNNYLDETALRHANMKTVSDQKEKKMYKVEPPVCPKCSSFNLLEAQFCSKCMTPLSEAAIEKVTSQQAILREMIAEEIKKLL